MDSVGSNQTAWMCSFDKDLQCLHHTLSRLAQNFLGPYLHYAFGPVSLSKQCRLRSDETEKSTTVCHSSNSFQTHQHVVRWTELRCSNLGMIQCLLYLNITPLWANSADNRQIDKILLIFFFQKIGIDILCK